MDVAAVGGAGLFSARAPFSAALTEAHDGLLLADDPFLWRQEIDRLATNLETARFLADNLRRTAERIGSTQQLRRFWSERLGLDGVEA
jgi:hypothetical protein